LYNIYVYKIIIRGPYIFKILRILKLNNFVFKIFFYRVNKNNVYNLLLVSTMRILDIGKKIYNIKFYKTVLLKSCTFLFKI